MIVHFSAHISKWELVCKFGVIFHIFIISCLCSRFHVRNQWFFLLCNNLFIYQVLCTLINRRRSLYSFLLNSWQSFTNSICWSYDGIRPITSLIYQRSHSPKRTYHKSLQRMVIHRMYIYHVIKKSWFAIWTIGEWNSCDEMLLHQSGCWGVYRHEYLLPRKHTCKRPRLV